MTVPQTPGPKAVATPRWAVVCLQGLLLALPGSTGSLAQDGGPIELTFGIVRTLEVTDNLDFDTVSAGVSTVFTNALSFGATWSTPLDTLSLTGSGALRLRDGPGISGVDRSFDDRRLGLKYEREGANAGFTFEARYRSAELTYLRPLEDFVNDSGEIVLPEDLDELTGTGRRVTYGIDSALEMGREGPLGVTLTAGLSRLDYVGVSDPDLDDSRRSRLGAKTRLAFSPVLTGFVDLNYRTYEAEDPENTRRETAAAEVSLQYDVSPATQVEVGIGQTRIDTEEFGVTTREDGTTARLGLTFARPNGAVTADLDRTVSQNGTRHSFELGREMDLPAGTLAASAGVTDAEGESPEFIAALSWRQDLPDGSLSARLRRSVIANADDDDELLTALALGYSREINAVSGLDFRLNHSYRSGTATADAVRTTSFSATYQRELTPEWALSAGYKLRIRDEKTDGQARSDSIFLTLGREFSFRP